MGLPHKQVATLFGVNEDSVSRWVRRFNQRGIDGLVEGSRSGRPSKISDQRTDEYRDLVLHPEHVDETHWTGRQFHGYLTAHCQLEAGYSTLMRWIHDEGFRLKVPRPWPDGQDEEKRKSSIELIRTNSKVASVKLGGKLYADAVALAENDPEIKNFNRRMELLLWDKMGKSEDYLAKEKE
jgi:transposase